MIKISGEYGKAKVMTTHIEKKRRLPKSKNFAINHRQRRYQFESYQIVTQERMCYRIKDAN